MAKEEGEKDFIGEKMDTTTKMIVMATREPEFAKVISILSDIMLSKVTKKTHKLAISMENSWNEYWKENMWLRYFAGTKYNFIDEKFINELKSEIDAEVSEPNKISI